MDKKEKSIVIIAVIVAAIFFLFFWRRNDAVAASQIVEVPGSNGLNFEIEVPSVDGIITDPNTYNFSGPGYTPSENAINYYATYGRNTGNYPPLIQPIIPTLEFGGNTTQSSGGSSGGCPQDNIAPANQYAINSTLANSMTPSLWINSVDVANNAISNGRFTRGW